MDWKLGYGPASSAAFSRPVKHKSNWLLVSTLMPDHLHFARRDSLSMRRQTLFIEYYSEKIRPEKGIERPSGSMGSIACVSNQPRQIYYPSTATD